MNLRDLSFTRFSESESPVLWTEIEEASYAKACAIGRDRADELANYVKESGDHSSLHAVIAEITRKEFTGVEAGFFARISAMMGACAPQKA